MPPNVLLVVFDTARADALEPYGAPLDASPVAADLVRRGGAITAVAPCSWTMPSHVSMFTGQLPRTVGLGSPPGRSAIGCKPVLDSLGDLLLPEVLRRAGYATSGASANPWITERVGFANGFEHFVEVRSKRSHTMQGGGYRARLSWALEAWRARVDDGAAQLEQVVNRWIVEAPRQPFFWFVNLMECHSPYLPPRPWNDLTPWARVRAADDARHHLTHEAICGASAGSFKVPAPSLDRMRHLYGRSVTLMDAWLGRILERLEQAGVLEDTIVLVTSDHGENLGENDLIGHVFSLDDRLITVPLVVAGPTPAIPERLTSLADLPALIAEWIGITSHPWTRAAEPGVAVSQLDPLFEAGDVRGEAAIAQWGIDPDPVPGLIHGASCATDGRHKLVRMTTGEWLYDLDDDPLEARPIPVAASTGRDLSGHVQRLRAALDEAAAAEGTGVPATATSNGGELPPDLEERMRLLGYL